MAIMSASQIAAELQRKKNMNLQPTNAANNAAYGKLTAQTPSTGLSPSTGMGTSSYGDATRKFLTDNGIANDQIGYSNGAVTVGGKNFITPSKVVNGTSYASSDDLNNALYGLQNREATEANKKRISDLEAAMSTPYKAPEFNYNAESDPVYQAALSRAKANAETASGDAMAELNKRGILNSTITSDRTAQIQQSELGKVSDTILPQLIQQAYSRYRDTVGDDYNASRNKITDLASILGIESDANQNRINNYNTDRTYNRGVFESDRDYAHTTARDAIADKQYQQTFDENVRQFGLQYALQKAQQAHQISNDNAQLAISRMNANTSRMNAKNDNARAASTANFNQLMDVWQASGTAPAGLESYGIKQGAAYGKGGSNNGMSDELSGLYSGLSSGQLSPDQALSEINGRENMGFTTKEEATKMRAFVQQYLEGGKTGDAPKPQVPDATTQTMTSDQLMKAWETDPTGKKAGRAKYDWVSWMTDPRGKAAGSSYEVWKSKYGPKL